MDYELKCCTITNLYVNILFRNRGIGTKLLKKCFEISDEIVEFYELDDMTDRYNKKNNIYIKNGFYYVNVENGYAVGPEMIKNCNLKLNNK